MTKNKRKQKKHLKNSLKQLDKLVAAKQSKKTEQPALPTHQQQIDTYNQQLVSLYDGNVKALERYINPKAIIKHYCNDCYREFFARPEGLLSNKQPHLCYDPDKRVSAKYTGKVKVTDDHIKKMVELYNAGTSMTSIASQLKVSRPTVIKYLRKAGAY